MKTIKVIITAKVTDDFYSENYKEIEKSIKKKVLHKEIKAEDRRIKHLKIKLI